MRRLLLAAVLAAAAHLGLLDAHAVWSIQTVNTGTQVGLATLTAPAGTAATNSGSGRIKVSWTPPPAANQGTQTNLLRHNASNPQPDATLVAVGGATASYLDTGLAAGNVYCYELSTVAGQWSAPTWPRTWPPPWPPDGTWSCAQA